MKTVRPLIMLICLTGQIAFANGSSNNCHGVFKNVHANIELFPNGPHGGSKPEVDRTEAREAEKSGYASDGEVIEALSDLRFTTKYFFSHQQPYLTGSYGTHEISLQEKPAIGYGGKRETVHGGVILEKAIEKPMQPIEIKANGPLIVYFSYRKIGSTSIWAHGFKVFAKKDLAERFIATHDFETE